MTAKTSTAPLTPAMVDAIKATGPEDVMAGGSTRTGLINRGLVHPKGSDRFGKLTEGGLMLRAKMLPAPVKATDLRNEEAQRSPERRRNLVLAYGEAMHDDEAMRPARVATEDQAYEVQEAEVAATWTIVPRQNGKAALADAVDETAVIVDPKAGDQAEAWTEPAAGTLRTRFHGKTLQGRRQARKNQKAARRRTRAKTR